MEDSRISSRVIFHFFLSYFFLSCLRMHAQILRNLFPNIQLPRWDVVLLLLLLLLFTWYLSKHIEFHTLLWWTEWGVTQSVSFVIILKNNCTGRSSSTVHLFTKFKLGAKWNILASAFTKKKGRGDFSDKAGFLQIRSFWIAFPFWNHCSFFGSHQFRNHSFLGVGWQDMPHSQRIVSCPHGRFSDWLLLFTQSRYYNRVLTIFFQY